MPQVHRRELRSDGNGRTSGPALPAILEGSYRDAVSGRASRTGLAALADGVYRAKCLTCHSTLADTHRTDVAERALRHNPDSAATRQLVSELATNGCVKR